MFSIPVIGSTLGNCNSTAVVHVGSSNIYSHIICDSLATYHIYQQPYQFIKDIALFSPQDFGQHLRDQRNMQETL